MNRILRVVVCVLLFLPTSPSQAKCWADPQAGKDVWPFDPADPTYVEKPTKKVFAHYMLGFQLYHAFDQSIMSEAPLGAIGDDLTDFKCEVQRAIEAGIDGFAMHSFRWRASDFNQIMQAANEVSAGLGKDFKILMMPDYSQGGLTSAGLTDFYEGLLSSPQASALFRLVDDPYLVDASKTLPTPNIGATADSLLGAAGGPLVVAPFDPEGVCWNPNPARDTCDENFWDNWIKQFRARQCTVKTTFPYLNQQCPKPDDTDLTRAIAFVPVFNGGWAAKAPPYTSFSYGFSNWEFSSINFNNAWGQNACAAHDAQRIWMATARPQETRAGLKIFTEAGNSQNFRKGWWFAIAQGQTCDTSATIDGQPHPGIANVLDPAYAKAVSAAADWVEITTWNDYGEGTEISPSTGIQYSFLDLSAYYIRWFKTGKQPTITRDVLYYFHRKNRYESATQAQAPANYSPEFGDLARNTIELLAFVAPNCPNCKLRIKLNGVTLKEQSVTGGGEPVSVIADFPATFTDDFPVFELDSSDAARKIAMTSAYKIVNAPTNPDLLYRGGSSSRTPVPHPQQ